MAVWKNYLRRRRTRARRHRPWAPWELLQIVRERAAAGLEVSFMRKWSARLEVRELNQVSPAFRAPSGDIRHRSREFVIKVGMRPGA